MEYPASRIIVRDYNQKKDIEKWNLISIFIWHYYICQSVWYYCKKM